ncbi:MAG: hypothetical protein ACFCU3_01010 [Verrucomicrobiales bacterium]
MKSSNLLGNTRQKGFTLVEISFSLGLLVVATAVLFSLMEIGTRLFARIMSVSIVESTGRQSIENVSILMQRATEDGYQFIDQEGATLPPSALGGYGVRFRIWRTANVNEAEDNRPVSITIWLVENELRLYEGPFDPTSTQFRILSDQFAEYNPDPNIAHSWPFHRGSFGFNAVMIDLNFKLLARQYDNFLSGGPTVPDRQNANTYFHIRALAGPR